MSERKESFGEKLARIWRAILEFFGLCPMKDLNDLRQSHKEATVDLELKINEKNEQIAKLMAQCNRYRDEVPTENLQVIKDLESQIHGIYVTSRNFGFPNSVPLPGSATMTDAGIMYNDTPFIDLNIRAIATDEETARINQEPDQRRRFIMMIDILRNRGFLTRIGERIITSGAATVGMAYNPDCTNYEVYVDVAAKILPDGGIVHIEHKQ